jgi:two-component system, NarL family, nitrate/nitrite response regulator NarL
VERVAADRRHMSGLRVLIVDDSYAFLQAAQRLLEQERLDVVGCALTSPEAMQLARRLRPDVVLVDVMLGGESGLELARRLVDEEGPGGPAVILVSTHDEEDLAELLAESPAAGFVAKSDLCAAAIRQILTGRER